MVYWTTRGGLRRSLAALAVAAGSLGAQAPKCDIPTQNQAKLIPATLMFNGAFKPNAKPEDKLKSLAGTVRALTDDVTAFPAPAQAGRNFMLAQALLVWMEQPGIGMVEPRGKVGYTANPSGTVHIPFAIDTAFAAIRAIKPECSDSLRLYTNGIWGQLINKAVTFSNAQELDSAEAYSRSSLRFDSTQVYAFSIMANIALAKEDTSMMIEWFNRTIRVTEASKDTNAIKIRDNMLTNLGAVYSNAASAATGAKKDSLAAAAVATYTRYLQFYPNDLATKLRIMRSGGSQLDSAGAVKFVDEVLANADGISDAQLADAGGELTRNKLYSSGLRLFEGALTKNPYSRDALYNSAVALNNLERFDEIRPYFSRLRELDPNNPGIYSLARNVQASRKLAIQTRANKGVKPRAGQSITLTPAQQAQIKVFNDSLVHYTALIQNLNPMVDVRSFSAVAGGMQLGAVVQVPPDKPAASYTLLIDFLDASGAAVASQTVRTKQIDAGGVEQVTTEGKGSGIVAFRYKVAK